MTVKDILYAVMTFVGIYLGIFLSWILIPACVFIFVLYVVKKLRDAGEL